MKRLILGAMSAAALVACQNKTDKVQAERADVVEARQEYGQEVAETRVQAAEETAEAREEYNEETAKAGEELAEKRADAFENVAEKRNADAEKLMKEEKELAEAKAEEAEKAAKDLQAATVIGRVTGVSDDSFKLETAAGDDFKLGFSERIMALTPEGAKFDPKMLQEGDQVRASYFEDGGEKVVNKINILSKGTAK